jgi:hypothetical protein
MITRHASLSQALEQLESGRLSGISTVVVSRRWWDKLSLQARKEYRARAGRAGVKLRSDSAMSAHFVEARGSDTGPLSTERPT